MLPQLWWLRAASGACARVQRLVAQSRKSLSSRREKSLPLGPPLRSPTQVGRRLMGGGEGEQQVMADRATVHPVNPSERPLGVAAGLERKEGMARMTLCAFGGKGAVTQRESSSYQRTPGLPLLADSRRPGRCS